MRSRQAIASDVVKGIEERKIKRDPISELDRKIEYQDKRRAEAEYKLPKYYALRDLLLKDPANQELAKAALELLRI